MGDNPSAIAAAAALLLPIGLVVRSSRRLVYGARGPTPGDAVYHLTGVLAWVLILVGLAAIVVATTVFSVVLLGIVGYAALELVLARRAQARQQAWSLVSSAARSGRSLPEAVEVGRDRFSGRMLRRFERFADDVQRGVPTSDAIARRPRAFPRHAQAAAALAKGGDLGLLAEAGGDDTPTGVWGRVTGSLSYLLLLLAVGPTILTFVFLKIVPEFRKIFDEFGLALPLITEATIVLADVIGGAALGPLLMLVTGNGLLAVFVLWALYLIDFHPLRPLTDRLFFGRHRARVLRLLAAAARRGQPFEQALEHLAHGRPRYPGHGVTPRLRHALRAARTGVDWRESLQRAGLLRPAEAPLLHAAERAGNLPWAMEALADQALGRSLRRWQGRLQLFYPVFILTLGLVVGWIVIGLFVPLIKLIEGLT